MSGAFHVLQVQADLITPHATNVRKDLGDLAELAASIKGMGVLQPLTVAPEGDGYVLIVGHRRHAAAIKAGIATVPCIVRSDLDTEVKQLQAMLVENLQRTDLTVMEEADAYQQLELLGVKEAAIAKATGRSRATVHQRLLLASLPTARREQYETGKLSLDGAVKCAKLRHQYADDAEILTAIDKAQTWQFSNGYGLDYEIQRILDSRKPQPEPEEDEDTIDYAGKRAEREAEAERQKKEREQRGAALRAAQARMYDWLFQRLVVRDELVIDGLIDWALEDLVDNHDLRDAVPMLGIDAPGDDEDWDDATARLAASLKALPREDKVLALALGVSSAAATNVYFLDDHLRAIAALGYPLTADDKALMKDDQ